MNAAISLVHVKVFQTFSCDLVTFNLHVSVAACCSMSHTLTSRLSSVCHASLSPLLSQRRPVRRRFESPGMYSDDDANSDASSACSERSYSSRNGGSGPHYLRQTEDVAEVLNHCASSNWSERKEGLLGLQNLLKSQRMLRWGPRNLRHRTSLLQPPLVK